MIALVLFDWFPHGGLQRDCMRIGKALLQQGAQVDVICMTWDGPVPEGMNPLISTAFANKKAIKGKVAQRKAFSKFVLQKTTFKNYAAVIGFNRLPGLDYYFAADTSFAWKAYKERGWFYRQAPRSRQYLAFENAVFAPESNTRILMLSPGQKEEYLALYPQALDRMIDIPPGIEKNRMAGADAVELRQSLRQEFAIEDDQLLVLQVGSGFSIKGVDRSLEAMASLPDALKEKTQLFIIGRDNAERYKKMADEFGLAQQISFLKSRDDLPRFFQGADLLLHPSYKESAGMVLLEAIVAGLPVLCAAACGYAFHVEKANAGCVIDEPFDQQKLNETLATMLSDLSSKDDDAKNVAWKNNGIEYGQSSDLYDMPESVARLVISAVRENVNER